jgi:hypothetical protein
MNNKPIHLPLSNSLNIAALSRLFNNTTNSYKFIFFLSILDILARRKFDVKKSISFFELTVEMLANAWFPHTFFKLSFGTQDTIAKKLDSLALDISEPVFKFRDTDKKLLRKAISSAELGDAERLMEFVPFRLLIPFLEEELKNIDKGKWMVFELAMPSITNQHFDSKNPLYKFDSDNYKECRGIFFNERWAEYLKLHFSIIYNWASWHWLHYMQKRNPSTPAISSKLFMPIKRDSLAKQTTYWKRILDNPQGRKLTCIYSGTPLHFDDFSLDHFLPWSFVAHDQLWNLIPTTVSVNSSKSNNIPDKRYFDNFIQTQYDGLLIARQIFSRPVFDKQTENFVVDLGLSPDDLLKFNKFQNSYQNTLNSLSALAINQGFSNGWSWQQ